MAKVPGSSSALTKLQKVIHALQKEELEHIQRLHGDTLKQIVTLARENNLTSDHIASAMNAREAKKERIPRASIKSKRSVSAPSVSDGPGSIL